ncbi:MAG: hypothetical protein HYX44_09665 [Aquabacterium sp.]|nr:hypothetical protein [Aquabacterium sp.]
MIMLAAHADRDDQQQHGCAAHPSGGLEEENEYSKQNQHACHAEKLLFSKPAVYVFGFFGFAPACAFRNETDTGNAEPVVADGDQQPRQPDQVSVLAIVMRAQASGNDDADHEPQHRGDIG